VGETKEYKESDDFARWLIRQIRGGKRLKARNFPSEDIPLDVATLEIVKERYAKFVEKERMIGEVR